MTTHAGGGRRGPSATSARILDVAEELVQMRGFNCVSYADVASELRITKAALHYHYPAKAELGLALIARYADRFAAALQVLDATATSASAKLDSYINLHADELRQRKMSLCGMLAAEYPTLPAPMQSAVVRFFDQNEDWLARVLEQGKADGVIHFCGPARDTAQMIISVLEGAMLVARPHADIERFLTTAARLLSGLYAPQR